MIDEIKAKSILNYIQKANLNSAYEIIPFDGIDDVDPSLWEDVVCTYHDTDEIVKTLIKENYQLGTHVYKVIKNIPSSLKKLGHMLDVSAPSQTFFCGREKELHKINVIRYKKIKNNVLIIGKPGVGKTSLVEAYAKQYEIKNIFVVECAKLISNTEYRGTFEKKVVELMDFAKGMDLILFFDEIHVLLNLGKTTGGISITDILKPYLLDERMCFIGATTLKEAQYLLMDEAFKRRFASVVLEEPSDETLLKIKDDFERTVLHDQLLSRTDALRVINILRNELKKQYFPDKFVDFMDFMYAFKSVNGDVAGYNILLEEYIHDQEFEIFNEECQISLRS